MFGIGFSELIIIAIIALIAIGPDKLPELAAKAGRFIWDIRRAWDDVRDSVKTEMMAIKQPLDELRNATQTARDSVRREANEFRTSVEKTVQESKSELRGAVEGKQPAVITESAPEKAPEQEIPEVTPEQEPIPAAGPQPYKKPRAAPLSTTYFDLDGNPVEPVGDA